MEHQQQRDAEAKAELPPFPARRKAQKTPHVNLPQRIRKKGKQRRLENRSFWSNGPGGRSSLPALLLRVAARSRGPPPSAPITARVTGSDTISASVGSP